LADPAVRKKMSEASRRALADPAVRKKMDWLAPDQIEQLLDQLRRGDRAIDVANDWLISISRVYSLARQHGVVLRTKRSAAAPLTAIPKIGRAACPKIGRAA
jgi:hypothetical protein